jgi:hypothetical protein
MSINIGRFGLMSLLAQAALGGGSGFIEPSPCKETERFKPSPKKTVTTAAEYRADSEKLAKRRARGKRLFRP